MNIVVRDGGFDYDTYVVHIIIMSELCTRKNRTVDIKSIANGLMTIFSVGRHD